MAFSITRVVPALGLAVLLMSGTAALPLAAQEADAPSDAAPAEAALALDTVLANVGDETITEADLTFAAEDLTQELQQIPAEERRAFLLRVLIDMKVMANAAREDGMDETPLFAQRLEYLEDRALRRAYFAETIAAAVTPEAVSALYDELIGAFEPVEEIRARHILVETEEEALALRAELEAGADFAELASAHSIDPGAANGGDLGFFRRGMMVAPFETAAFGLTESGETSEPVQSQFGWHLIRLEERRESAPPSLEQLAPQLQQQVLMDTFDETVARLTSGTTIEIVDAELAAAVEAQQAAEDAAAQGQ